MLAFVAGKTDSHLLVVAIFITAMFFAALVISIPAFYLLLSGAGPGFRHGGNILYGLMALLMVVDWRRGAP